MVRKKGKRRSRRGGKKNPAASFIASIKRALLATAAALVCLIGLLYVYNYFFPVSRTTLGSRKPVPEETAVPARKKVERPETAREEADRPHSNAGAARYTFPARAEIPEWEAGKKRKEQIIRHEGYTVSYNSDYRIANWVAYELTSKEAKSKKATRSNKFVPDPLVKGATALNEDYTRTGYDRGHLAPAGDMKWSMKAMRESFYLSNICPQDPDLNRGIWKELEEQIRLWASENGSLLVVTGPIITDDLRRLGKNRVGIPKRFFKVVCTQTAGRPEGVGFLFDNRDYGDTSLRSMMIPIDSVESVTGIDFFPSLPDSIERPMEASVNKSCWSI